LPFLRACLRPRRRRSVRSRLDDGDQILTIYAAEPDTPDGERLARLADSVRVTTREARPVTR
jgi:hypothetical protein